MPHPNAGRKHTPEHIAKRVAAVAAAKAAWSDEKKAAVARKIGEANARRPAEAQERFAKCGIGKSSWNKGRNWRDGLTPEQVRAVNNERCKRRREQPKAIVHGRISALVRFTLKRVGGTKGRTSWPQLLGYGFEQLKAHLMTTLPDGYCWQDYVDGRLHLDHIVPTSAFNFEAAVHLDFQRCWALSNLRLLPARENLDKRARLDAPFQPSLAI